MSNFISSLSQKVSLWWSSLSGKDRKTLLFALPIVLILILYLLVFQPIYSRYSALEKEHRELSDTLVWLYDNAALVNRLQNQCSRLRLLDQGDDDALSFVKNISRRGGATATVKVDSDQALSVEINQLSGNRAVALVQSYLCHGFSVKDVQLNRNAETDSNVEMSLRLLASSAIRGG